MSNVRQVLNSGQQAITNYDVSKIFIWNNRYVNETIVNSQYNPWVLDAGTVMGRITGTNTIVPCSDDATDGSQNPIGILAADIVINSGASATVPLCTAGDVAQSQIILLAPLTLEYPVIVGGVSIRMKDRIRANTGINIVGGTENTYLDNQ